MNMLPGKKKRAPTIDQCCRSFRVARCDEWSDLRNIWIQLLVSLVLSAPGRQVRSGEAAKYRVRTHVKSLDTS